MENSNAPKIAVPNVNQGIWVGKKVVEQVWDGDCKGGVLEQACGIGVIEKDWGCGNVFILVVDVRFVLVTGVAVVALLLIADWVVEVSRIVVVAVVVPLLMVDGVVEVSRIVVLLVLGG